MTEFQNEVINKIEKYLDACSINRYNLKINYEDINEDGTIRNFSLYMPIKAKVKYIRNSFLGNHIRQVADDSYIRSIAAIVEYHEGEMPPILCFGCSPRTNHQDDCYISIQGMVDPELFQKAKKDPKKYEKFLKWCVAGTQELVLPGITKIYKFNSVNQVAVEAMISDIVMIDSFFREMAITYDRLASVAHAIGAQLVYDNSQEHFILKENGEIEYFGSDWPEKVTQLKETE